MQFKIATFFVLAASVFAAPGDIPFSFAASQLKSIEDATSSFNKAISNWNGAYLQGLPILAQGTNLAKIITSAVTAPVSGGDSDNDEDAQEEAFDAAEKLAEEVKKTVDAAIDAKPKLERVPILGAQAGLRIFQLIFTAAKTLSNVLVENTLPDQQDQARNITDTILGELQRGIKAYS